MYKDNKTKFAKKNGENNKKKQQWRGQTVQTVQLGEFND